MNYANYKNIAKTYRYIPDPQPHLAVLFHKYSPQHVSHDDDEDDDRRRCLEYSRRPRRRQSFFDESSLLRRSDDAKCVRGVTRESFQKFTSRTQREYVTRDCKDTDLDANVRQERSSFDKHGYVTVITYKSH